MTWLTWRQFRVQAWVAGTALAVLAIALALTGPHLAHLYTSSGIAGCRTDCDSITSAFLNTVRNGATGSLFNLLTILMFGLPAVIGVFWGAPLVARELEAGTYRLAWNQSVTRTRWLAVKLASVGLASMATAGLFSLAVSWWADPIDSASLNRLEPQVFASRGIVPIGYAAFAFALGVAVGLLIRRTVPAMAVTLAGFAAAQIVMPTVIRAHLFTPRSSITPLDISRVTEFSLTPGGRMVVTGAPGQPGAWILSNRTLTPTGSVFAGPANKQFCGRSASPRACMDWVGSLHLRQALTYQPAGRFWAFQWTETGIYLAAALLLTGVCFWWIRRRLT